MLSLGGDAVVIQMNNNQAGIGSDLPIQASTAKSPATAFLRSVTGTSMTISAH